jgi:H+-translocating NAD(P) transhydrogenase subunit beta
VSTTTSNLLYLLTIVSFIVALRFLSSPRRARQGTWVGAAGMALAIAVTVAHEGLENYVLIAVAMALGAVVGVVGARRVKMTAMPQMVALFNGVGGGAAALIALAEFDKLAPEPGRIGGSEVAGIIFSGLIGSISFSGSLVAFAKLQELVSGRPITYRGQQVVNGVVLAVAVGLAVALAAGVSDLWALVVLVGAALVFGS